MNVDDLSVDYNNDINLDDLERVGYSCDTEQLTKKVKALFSSKLKK